MFKQKCSLHVLLDPVFGLIFLHLRYLNPELLSPYKCATSSFDLAFLCRFGDFFVSFDLVFYVHFFLFTVNQCRISDVFFVQWNSFGGVQCARQSERFTRTRAVSGCHEKTTTQQLMSPSPIRCYHVTMIHSKNFVTRDLNGLNKLFLSCQRSLCISFFFFFFLKLFFIRPFFLFFFSFSIL